MGLRSIFYRYLRNCLPLKLLDRVNTTAVVKDPEWPVRDSLMQTYYSLKIYATKHNNVYTTDLKVLADEAGNPQLNMR